MKQTGYAQTFPQLLNQVAERLGAEEMELLVRAFQFALPLFSGAWRASGKTFLAHGIGTASIAFAHGARGRELAVALLHAVYTHGDFGWRFAGSPANRRVVAAAMGPEVEQGIWRYGQERWNRRQLQRWLEQADWSEELRAVLFLRLCNELEEYLDGGIVYCGRKKLGEYQKRQAEVLAVARRLGREALGEELAERMRETREMVVGEEFTNPTRQPDTARVASASYQQRPLAWAVQVWRRVRRSLLGNSGR